MLRKWQKGMTASNVKFDSLSLWVQIWGAPFDMFSPTVAMEMGSRMGVVEEVEKRPKKEAQSLFMRVKVSLPVSKPIRRGSFIAGTDGGRTWVSFKYERLPMLCHYCGLLGHDTRHCASHYAASKNGKEVVCQYGDWMKAMGVRYGSPSKKKSKEFEQPSDDKEETNTDGGGSTTVEAAVMNSTNPTENVNGNCSNYGDVTEVQAVTKSGIKETWPSGGNNPELMLEDPAVGSLLRKI